MKITIICSSKDHPVFPWLLSWKNKHNLLHEVSLINVGEQAPGGDIMFLISCNEVIREEVRSKYKKCLVIHASNVPAGRGWSPHIWQILAGENSITVTLMEANNKVDAGLIWAQRMIELEGHELYDEINEKLFLIEVELLDFAIENFFSIKPFSQPTKEPTYYRKRTPQDSRIDPNKTISEQFELLRVADPNRFPAFFDFRNHKYFIEIKKHK